MYESKHISQHNLAQYSSAAKASQTNGAFSSSVLENRPANFFHFDYQLTLITLSDFLLMIPGVHIGELNWQFLMEVAAVGFHFHQFPLFWVFSSMIFVTLITGQ